MRLGVSIVRTSSVAEYEVILPEPSALVSVVGTKTVPMSYFAVGSANSESVAPNTVDPAVDKPYWTTSMLVLD